MAVVGVVHRDGWRRRWRMSRYRYGVVRRLIVIATLFTMSDTRRIRHDTLLIRITLNMATHYAITLRYDG